MEAWADTTICPRCDRHGILRNDTGGRGPLCESCTAKLPEKVKEWQAIRRRVSSPTSWYRPINEPMCLLCNEPLNGAEPAYHEQYICSARKFSCRVLTCGRRFWLSAERDDHLRKAHGLPA